MLNKIGIELGIKEVSQGAWFSHKSVQVGISLRPELQYFFVHHESRNEQTFHFWDYRKLVAAIIQPLGVQYNQLSRENIRSIVQLHDRLIANHIPAFVQILLKAQVMAGQRQYNPINPEIAQKVFGRYFMADVQNYKIAGLLFNLSLAFMLKMPRPASSYEEQVGLPLENWRGQLAQDFKPSRALHKTIDSWTGKVPPNITRLSEYKLERPLHAMNVRLLLALSESRVPDSAKENLAHIIQHTKPRDIAMLLALPQIRGNRGYRNNNPYEALMEYLADGMRMDNSNYASMTKLSSMFNESHRTHENEARRRAAHQRITDEAQRAGHKAWMATKTKEPFFELPEKLVKDGTIRFLDTVGACHAEGRVMGHCIASYSEMAVRGDCFLFHVEYQGEQASIEVSPQGLVRQARGPENELNGATEYGTRLLGEIIRTWKETGSKKPKSAGKKTKTKKGEVVTEQ